MVEKQLLTGVAYHGNRMTKHVVEDMEDIVRHNMNYVVHMFSHMDWVRHKTVMKDIFDITKSYGLDVWVDNWGLAGTPGDKSHFLSYHPEAHQIFNDGTMNPTCVCFNSEAFIQFTKDWLDTVRELGGDTIFWDEPSISTKKDENGNQFEACFCPTCRKLFEEIYHHPMPNEVTDETRDFRHRTILRYFDRVTAYSASLGMKNVTCVMLHTLDYTKQMIQLPHLDNFGADPYWAPRKHPEHDPYDFVYHHTQNVLDIVKPSGKDTHIWLQAYDIPAGCEDDIYLAANAIYDAGARNIVAWSYRGGESNTYRADNCERVWQVVGESMGALRRRYMDEICQKHREAMQNK